MPETTDQPQIPDEVWTADPTDQPANTPELWMLWFPAGDLDCKPVKGHWGRAIDGGPHDLYLACTSEAEAVEAAEYQNENYYLDRDCYPVRVK